MADNVAVTPGAGDTIAADDVGGVKYQRIKLAQGADGSATDVSSAAPLQVTLANTGANATAVKTDGSAVTQPVSAASLPLPSGAATSAKQDTIIGHVDGVETLLGTIDGDTGNIATSVASIDTKVDALTTPSDTQLVSAASLPLPTGAATSAKQDTSNTSLSSIDGKITAVNTGAVVVSSSALPSGAATAAKQPALGTAGTSSADVITVQGRAAMTPLLTDGSGTTQPVSGTVTANLSATDNAVLDDIAANQTDGTHKTQIVDSGGEVATVTGGKLDVNATASLAGETLPVSGTTEAVAVAIVDTSGDQIASFGGGVQYTEGDVDATPTGSPAMFRLNADDSIVSVSETVPLPVVDAAGNVVLDTISTNTDTSTGHLATIAGDTATIAVSLSDPATETTLAAINAKLVSGTDIGDVTVNNASGAAAVNVQDGGNSLTVDYATTGSGTATGALRVELPTNGTGVIATVGAVTAITNALPAGTNAIGKLAANSGVDIGDVDVTSIPGIVGTIADDSTTPGAPVMVGGMAKSPDGTDPGSVSAENDVARVYTDLNRRMLVNDEHPRWWSYHVDGSSALTDASVQADPGDGFQIVITDIIFSNGAATAINMFLEEGSTKILGPIYLEAINGRGFVWKGKKHVTASTAVTITTSSATAHSVEILGYIQAV